MSQIDAMLAEIEARAGANHQFTTHPTYTGEGCAKCGKDEQYHDIPRLVAALRVALVECAEYPGTLARIEAALRGDANAD